MEIQRVSETAPLPTFLRGSRALAGVTSIRRFHTLSSVSVAALSRLERGYAVPSVDMLLRWSAGCHDGRPDPELWASAVYAASATWEDAAEFALVRYADPHHDPVVCWALARVAGGLTVEMVSGRHEWPDEVRIGANRLEDAGSRQYAHFGSALRSDAAADAACAAWFELFRGADTTVVAQASGHLLADAESAVESADGDSRLLLMLWLSEVYVRHGKMPTPPAASSPTKTANDPQLGTLLAAWPRLTSDTRAALVALASAAASAD